MLWLHEFSSSRERFLLSDKNIYQYSLSYFSDILSCTCSSTIQWCYCMSYYPHRYVYQTSISLCNYMQVLICILNNLCRSGLSFSQAMKGRGFHLRCFVTIKLLPCSGLFRTHPLQISLPSHLKELQLREGPAERITYTLCLCLNKNIRFLTLVTIMAFKSRSINTQTLIVSVCKPSLACCVILARILLTSILRKEWKREI